MSKKMIEKSTKALVALVLGAGFVVSATAANAMEISDSSVTQVQTYEAAWDGPHADREGCERRQWWWEHVAHRVILRDCQMHADKAYWFQHN